MGAQKMRSKLIEVSGFIPCLCNSASFSVHNASLQRMYSVCCCTSVCVGGCVFPALVIQNLWVCWVASLQEMYSIGCFSNICVGACVFPAFIIQNLWVCSVASLEEMHSVGCCSSICVGDCVFLAFNKTTMSTENKDWGRRSVRRAQDGRWHYG